MKNDVLEFTHIGWFWFCPVLIWMPDDPYADEGVTESEGECAFHPRHWSLFPLFWAAEALEAARIWASSIVWPDYEPSFMVAVTGYAKPQGVQA